ncbi:hypothetical protein HN51_004486 [Arachis hypogaea]|uniref:uncharacterized protein n=1 Tax=Arachis hypogaea TaxID=3818 RepID=UPI000DECE28B|nr:LRR receptor-like serine/threonine-protein kinase GSO1 [Arachis hypogaea]QHO38059.1 LRR receptor-like serine/threonine-protein kinase [Arachis hypogaea]
MILLLLFFFLGLSNGANNVTETTLKVLLEVKSSFLQDPLKVLADWRFNNTNYCSWNGITCNDDKTVVGINLSSSSLNGSISPSLSRLQSLLHLDLSSNSLVGPIPVTLTNLTSLESLLLLSNQLTGHVPAEFGSMLTLRILKLGDNLLTGFIPPSLGNLVKLNFLGLAYNALAGTIPTHLGQLTELQQLVLKGNMLTGTIPVELGNCSSLQILNLASNRLTGQLPSQLGELSELTDLVLMDNQLVGNIPKSLFQLGKLQILDLSMNNLTGEVPGEFGNLRELQNLSLSWNQFHGSTIPSTMCSNYASKLVSLSISDCGLHGVIPIELAQCVSLKVLDLANNSLSGSISPFIIGNLTNLEEIYLYRNKLHGSFPREIGKLGKLQSLSLFENQLSGQIPLEIGNCLGLQLIDLFGNQFSGGIPITIGRLKELNWFHLRNNNLEGKIPATLGNCQKMKMIDLANNQLSGSIPATLGFLRGLDQLMLYNNSLEGNLPHQLANVANLTRVNLSRNKLNGSLAPLCSSSSFLSFDVTDNKFDGVIPFQLGNSHSLDRLRLGNNRFSGEIPRTLGKITEMTLLDLSRNSLSGPIPDELSLCHNLSHIDLNNNSLTGPIPSWLGTLPELGELKLSFNQLSGSLPLGLFNCTKLLVLCLDGNSLNGSLPGHIGNLTSLNVLRLGQNNLTGSIPQTVGRLINLYELQLSRNGFSGEIPFEIGNLQNLQNILDLSYNNLSGEIPSSIRSLLKLQALNLSHNQLSGGVPLLLGEMSSLDQLDLSYNNLQGQLDMRFCRRWPLEAFAGNLHLCGASKCSKGNGYSNKLPMMSLSALVIVSSVSSIVAIAILMFAGRVFLKNKQEIFRKFGEVNCIYSSSSHAKKRFLLPLNIGGNREYRWEDIMDATNNLSEEFIIGSGGSGTVYRAEWATGETVAVKKISFKDEYLLNKSFIREMKTLGRIRHRHLVKLIGCCSNRKKGCSGWNLLIYEYMKNGSVWDWLHGRTLKEKGILDWDARFRIAVGLAHGLEYLHHDCVPKIIHRDIKTSNILLDSKMDAHLGDFGLAKALVDNSDSTSCFAGSYGYIAPEYAYTMKATEKSDVYSMGIVFMELVSGKMPTDEAFRGNMDMVRWVEMHFHNQDAAMRQELIDPELKPPLPTEEFAAFQVVEIAMQCTKTAPQERPSSRQVCDLLQHVAKNKRFKFEKKEHWESTQVI